MVSEYLKQHTAEYHDAAEALFNSRKIFSKTFTLKDYKKIIGTNYLMLLHAEERIFRRLSGTLGDTLQLEERKKLPLIEKDLAGLTIESRTVSGGPEFTSEHEALGAMYVIEGSTLGGNVIARQLSKTEGFDQVTFHFFGCYGDQTGVMWKNFKEILDTRVPEDKYDEVLAGARKLYTFLLHVN